MAITLKALRVNAGYDQKTAAQLIGVTPETLGSWEKGRSYPTVPLISKIENLYGVEYADINFSPNNVGLTEIKS